MTIQTETPSAATVTFANSHWTKIALAGLASLLYFADILLKASAKCFWYDELVTVYLCRLPDFRSTWTAVTHGADLNPPLFYLLTRGAERLFGEGLIATRLPEIAGVWLFCACVYLFVSRRAGPMAGLVAGIFPFFTIAQYYAYEARPHGIVLGWCGLALVCWQRMNEGTRRRWWVAGFALALAGSLMTHVYAVYMVFAFALVELSSAFKKRRVEVDAAAAIILPLVLAAVIYLPLFHTYRSAVPLSFFPPSHDVLERFLTNGLAPSIGVLLLSFALLAIRGSIPGISLRQPRDAANANIPRREILLAFALSAIPIFGMIGARLSHGPYLDRYFLSGIAGYAIFLSFALSRNSAAGIVKLMVSIMLFLVLVETGSDINLSRRHGMIFREPSSGSFVPATPEQPMQMYSSLLKLDPGTDALVLSDIKYLFFLRYAPPAIASRLYVAGAPDDPILAGYKTLATWAHLEAKPVTYKAFFSAHQTMAVYGDLDSAFTIQTFVGAGYLLKSIQKDPDGILYHYEKK